MELPFSDDLAEILAGRAQPPLGSILYMLNRRWRWTSQGLRRVEDDKERANRLEEERAELLNVLRELYSWAVLKAHPEELGDRELEEARSILVRLDAGEVPRG